MAIQMRLFQKRSGAGADWLIVGLGNPGKQYEGTRHNVGWAALETLAEEHGIAVRRSKFDGLVGSGAVNGQRVVLLKPLTYMNLSGKSVSQAAAFYKLGPEKVLVLCDDINLPAGVLRLRMEGGAGGHNGLKSIIGALGEGFPRIKIGVGAKPDPNADLADWVLAKPSKAEDKLIAQRMPDAARAAALVVAGEAQRAMGEYNGPQA